MMIAADISACLVTLILTFFLTLTFGKDLGSLSSSEESNSVDQIASIPEDDRNTLVEAIRVLERRKRDVGNSHQPYSAYRPLSTHRYRYPLYKKRSYSFSPDYYDEPSGMDYSYDDYSPRLSMFREREQGPKSSLISNGHFFDKKSDKHSSNARGDASLYRQTKRASRNYPSFTSFFDSLDAIKNRYNRGYYSRNNDVDYYDLTKLYSPDYVSRHLMTRIKRSAFDTPAAAQQLPLRSVSEYLMEKEDNNSTTVDKSNSSEKIPKKTHRFHLPRNLKKMDRQKRAFRDVSKYVDQNRLRQEAENDFLTREYFKSIARSVGNKKKRMAHARFEAPSVDKKSNLDSFFEHPSTLQYVQEQLLETEEEIADDAEMQLRRYPSSAAFEDPKATMLLSNSIAKLDALEKMKKALYQLERLQEEDAIRKGAMNLVVGYGGRFDVEKRRKSLRTTEVDKRKDDIFQQIFQGNTREECPVLDRIFMNCVAITKVVGEEAKPFLIPCLKHEICYMCGSGLDVSRHECDALLSSALEAGCSSGDEEGIPSPAGSSLDCLSAAGDTLNALENPSRYDDKGTCTYDPCVRQLLD